MIRFEHVSKAYGTRSGQKVIVDDINLTFNRGRSIGLLGRNGAGKSTLLRMIAGTLAPDQGEIHRKGRISWPLGFSGGFHPALTGRQNTRFVARIYGVDTDALCEYVMDFSELGQFLDMPVSSYSSGMRARLAFGVSMGVMFDYYLVDEITAVGDAAFRRKCRAVFSERLVHSDVIMVSHSYGTIREYCSSAAVLENGQMTFYEDVEEGIAAYDEIINRS
ncbi:MAG: ABC transporter ATP-binding protein [Pseudomonadota bacterium]